MKQDRQEMDKALSLSVFFFLSFFLTTFSVFINVGVYFRALMAKASLGCEITHVKKVRKEYTGKTVVQIKVNIPIDLECPPTFTGKNLLYLWVRGPLDGSTLFSCLAVGLSSH